MRYAIIALGFALSAAGSTAGTANPSSLVRAGVDLAIGDDEIYRRPNSWSLNGAVPDEYGRPASRTGVSIAWRNADQVEEVEVRVVNFGDTAGSGRVSVDVVDAYGHALLHLVPPDGEETIQVPAATMGGLQGKIIRMKASWDLNALIDRFDLAHLQYGVMATIEPLGLDIDPSNNRKTKTWNNMSTVVPGGTTVFNYGFVNDETTPRTFRVRLDETKLPDGWKLTNSSAVDSTVDLQAGQRFSGTLTLTVPKDPAPPNGAFSEARIALVDAKTGAVYRQHEWFEIFDTVPPQVSNYRAVLLKDHTIAIQALVADQQSGVLEATGVSTQFSVDGGKTWAVKAHNYKTGNFIRPTLFETVLGPFAPGTSVMLRFAARDTAGNVTAAIPEDAGVFLAPAGAEQLLQLAYIFPRIKPNPLFEIEELRALALSVKAAQAQGVNIQALTQAEVARLGIPPARLTELGVDAARFADIKSDISRLGMLNLSFDQIASVPVKRVQAPGDTTLHVATIQVSVQ